jgi:hypothetical protein
MGEPHEEEPSKEKRKEPAKVAEQAFTNKTK